MQEMKRRGFTASAEWWDYRYRGKSCSPYNAEVLPGLQGTIYPEHNPSYYQDCIDNLAKKGITIAP